MLEPPRIVETTAQPAAVIRLTIPRGQIQQVMGPAFGELATTLAAQGLQPVGPFFSHHFRMDPRTFDFELGVPVARPVVAAGRVKPGELPAAKVVRTVYRGGYEGLGAAWGEFLGWIEAEQLATAPSFRERYLAGPESGPDASQWRTELSRPLAR